MSNTYAVEDLVNQAARSAGVPLRVEEIFEGSDLSRVALEVFGQARDELIASREWSFTRRTVALTLLKGPPPAGGYNFAQPWSAIYPRPGYLYEYAYPSDALDIRAIYPAPYGNMPDSDPVPQVWSVDDDPTPVLVGSPPTSVSGPEAKVIYCNATNAMANYRAQVTNVTLWPPVFIAAFVASLGKKLAVAFGPNPQIDQQLAGEAAAVTTGAAMVRG